MENNYKNLDVYKKADELVLLIYKVTKNFPKDELFGLVSQMRRCAVSIIANFVEGYGRKSIKEKIQFLHISLGSANELEYYIDLSRKLSYITENQFINLGQLHDSAVKLLQGYLRGINRNLLMSVPANSQLPTPNSASGQTLIETIVAIFVLTTGLSAGLALAIFAFGGASDITERITATGLAREGIEAVRRMRDSNWLAGTITDCGGNQQCYTTWLAAAYDIAGAGDLGRSFRLDFTPSSAGNKWTLNAAASDYRLRLVPGSGFSHAGSEQTNFFRKIFIITQTDYQILARSVVWWHGKNCPAITNYNQPSDTNCKIVTEEVLTNWKNY